MSNPRTPGEADRLIGQIVRDARERTRFTQQQVAAHLGISQQQYRKYEAGKSKLFLDTWIRLCRFLGIDPAEASRRMEQASAPGFGTDGTQPYVLPATPATERTLKKDALRLLDELRQLVTRMDDR